MLSKLLFVGWMACQSLDLGTTFVALNRGMVEANPVLGQSKGRIGGTKVAINAGAVVAYFRTKGNRRMIVSGTMAGTGCFAGAYNLHALKGR